MNFLLRTVQPSAQDLPTALEQSTDVHSHAKPATTLEGLIAEDKVSENLANEKGDVNNGVGNANGSGSPCFCGPQPCGGHLDVSEDEGWITIPYQRLPDNWTDATDMLSFRALDRPFIFPGEQVNLIVCLSSPKHNTEVITPFRVAAVMNKNGIREQTLDKETGVIDKVDLNGVSDQNVENSGEVLSRRVKVDAKQDISASENLLRMEEQKNQTETLLEKFKKSHFFVRLADSDEPFWSKKGVAEIPPDMEAARGSFGKSNVGSGDISGGNSNINAVVDRGDFDAYASGGMARSSVQCCSLRNGDIVVVIQVNIGTYRSKDPVFEVLQFEKYQASIKAPDNIGKLDDRNHDDPCRELLTWLLPLDHTVSPARSVSPPPGSTSFKSTFSASSSSQLFSFTSFRSQSVPSPSQTTVPPIISSSLSKPSFDIEDWDHLTSQKFGKCREGGNEGLLSYRGVALEPDRFSVHCGLEGIYIPGRRWRRKLEVVQPLEICSFAADCNTENLLCVQIKNVSPAHIPDILIFIDSIAIVIEKSPRGGCPVSIPIACIEAGVDHCLPNLLLRRGEEHSFILKPVTLAGKEIKAHGEKSSQLSHIASRASKLLPISKIEGFSTSGDQYSIVVSCRCNYTESKLFFKQVTSWRPHPTRDLMISVTSDMCKQNFGPNIGMSQLPVQVLTLQASNLTSDDLTLTVLAPASFMSPPSVISLNTAPSSPLSPFIGFAEFTARVGLGKRNAGRCKLNSLANAHEESQKESGNGDERSMSLTEQTDSASDVIPNGGFSCTHLWLQSTVPLGCIPSKSTATVKLELLPLTDGIITLDTLQIAVKERGVAYIPECSLKINATSSVATGLA